jgi:pSer/pThr/pTyr-binding forkhead associated (FHA) protein
MIDLETRVKLGNAEYAVGDLLELLERNTRNYSDCVTKLREGIEGGETDDVVRDLQSTATALRSLTAIYNSLEKMLCRQVGIAPGEHLLIVEDGRGVTEYQLDRPNYLIGKASECDIRLNSVFASRVHAKLTRMVNSQGEVRYKLIDGDPDQGKRSSNGTYVNNRSVKERDLGHYDQILFGADVKATYFLMTPDLSTLSDAANKALTLEGGAARQPDSDEGDLE